MGSEIAGPSVTPMRRALHTSAPRSVFIIRLLLGIVFLSEGIQKFLFAEELGAGRFARIGIPSPELMGPFVGAIEILSGALFLAGLFTRLAAALTLTIITVALVSTKIPVLLGEPFWIFSLPKLAKYGLWSMLHEGRADLSMWLCSLFLLVAGAGPLSLDAKLTRRVGRS